ncbi:MAG: DUF7133 domain-containing protein [Phycisphaeraceae bacterium]
MRLTNTHLVLFAVFTLFLIATKPTFAQAADVNRNDLDKRPGYQMPLGKAHPMWAVEQARPDDFQPQCGAIAFCPDGRYLAVCTFPAKQGPGPEDPNGTLYILENPTAKDASAIKVHTITNELMQPLGMNWLEEGLYVAERDEISKWTDTDGDGLSDEKSTFCSGWISDNFHHFTFGPVYREGYFYATLSTSLHIRSQDVKDSLEPGEGPAGEVYITPKGTKYIFGGNAPNPEFRGCVLKIEAKTGEFEPIAGGLRTPNGVGLGPKDILLCPDNQGDWKPSNAIYVVKGGEFLGKHNATVSTIYYLDGGVPSLYADKDPTPPAIWLPQNEIGNSPSATLLIPEGMPFAGQVLSADITQGAIHRIFMEEVDGTWQGAAFRHTMGLEAGPNDMKWGPDGCLYVGGMGSGSGNWGWSNKKFGLQRLRHTGKTVFEFEKIEATKEGFRVSFTKPVAAGQLDAISNWRIDAYTYTATREYGGPKKDVHHVVPTAVRVSEDRKSAELIIDNRKPNYVYHIRIDATSEDGETMWSPESWVTFHKASRS